MAQSPEQNITWKEHDLKEGDVFMEDSKENDIVIPIMGPPGVGKSTFINAALRQEAAPVGHDLNENDMRINHYVMNHPQDPERRIVFVEPPGFDESFKEGYEILRRTAVWLAKSYNDDMKVAGVIYLHDISQARVTGTFQRHWDIFRRLCGDHAMRNVVLVTTKWNGVDLTRGQSREEELAKTFWTPMLGLQAKMRRFTLEPPTSSSSSLSSASQVSSLSSSPSSAWDVVDLILGTNSCQPIRHLQIQEELVELQRILPETEAGQQLRYTLEELKQMQANDLDRLAIRKKLEKATRTIDRIEQELELLRNDGKPSPIGRIRSGLASIMYTLQQFLAGGPQSAMPSHMPQQPQETPPIDASNPIPTRRRSPVSGHSTSTSSSTDSARSRADFELTIMAWLADHKTPHQVTANVRCGNRLRLQTYRQELQDGAPVGTDLNLIEVYSIRTGRWSEACWDSPILIKHIGQAILVRCKGVKHLANWKVHKQYLLDTMG